MPQRWRQSADVAHEDSVGRGLAVWDGGVGRRCGTASSPPVTRAGVPQSGEQDRVDDEDGRGDRSARDDGYDSYDGYDGDDGDDGDDTARTPGLRALLVCSHLRVLAKVM